MKEHALFPTLVCEFDYPDHAKFKPVFYEHIHKYMTSDGYSSEYTNHVNIHHEPAYEPFFKYALYCVRQYTKRLHIDNDRFDFNLVKTWLNIKKDNSTPLHWHGDAHISLTYYVNIPTSFTRPLRFHHLDRKHEPYPGAIKWNNTSGVWDAFNAYSWEFAPHEGQLFVFPSTLPHDTVGQSDQTLDEGNPTIEELNQNRICLAADIVLTYKEQTPSPLGLQPMTNWRKFT